MKTRSLRAHWIFLMPLLVLFIDFLGPVVALQRSFIAGDFSVQHWPWAQHLYNAFREGEFPFWTDRMACGFPLIAEGQVAAFYGLRRILFTLLPFWPAYSWSIALHFLAGSLGFYAYARSIRLSRPGASLAMLAYAFGSAYAGCYYNTGSLRVLAWLPFLLLWIERMPQKTAVKRLGLAAFCALAVSQMWNAGFSQIALYAMGYAFCAALLNVRRRGGAQALGLYAVAVVLGTLLSAPQMALTIELIGQSIRQGESVAFALWGSAPPTAVLSLLFPEWGNIQRIALYVGIPALFAATVFFILPRARKDYRHVWLFLFFLLFSFGKLNPIYTALVQGLSLTILRNPAKFLFFAAASLSLVAGQGLDAMLLALKQKRLEKIVPVSAGLAIVAATLPGILFGFWRFSTPLWDSWSGNYLRKLLAEKGAAAKPTEYYRSLLDGFHTNLGTLFSYTHAHTLVFAVLGAATGLFLIVAAKKNLPRKAFLIVFFALAVIDFNYFGWNLSTGFVGNVASLASTKPDERIRFLQEVSTQDPGAIAEFVVDPRNEFLPPNAPMAFGLSHVGGYSPLLLRNYYDLTHHLGIVDGSLGRPLFSESAWNESRGLLDLIGVRYLTSDARLSWESFQEIKQIGNTLFYRNDHALPMAAAWTHARAIPNNEERLMFLKSPDYDARAMAVVERDPGLPATVDGGVFSIAEVDRWTPGKMRALYTLPAPGIGWARICAYPGWRLRVDGKSQDWFKVNHAFIGFRLEPGPHVVELDYVPNRYGEMLVISALAALVVLAAAFRFLLSAKPL